MASDSKQEGGAKAAEEEQLNIPSFVRITNTSGFVIPASILNRAWIALSRQIANRAQEAVKTVDHNFLVYFWSEVTDTAPLSPVTADTMISYADTVYDANIGHHFDTCIIPELFWTKTGYRATRLEKKFGEEEGYIDLRIWVEGFDNESLSASHRLSPSNFSTVPYIYIGTTFGQTVWCTDFLHQRMKAYNEAITKIFTQVPETLQIEHDSTDALCCTSGIDGEGPIISPIRDELYQFAKDSHRFLIKTCLNNDAKECITNMQDSNSEFPNFNNVSKLYYGLEVIPISSQGFSMLEPDMTSTKRPKAKAGKKKRRRAKRKTDDGVEQAGEDSNVATFQAETTEINYETKVEDRLEVSIEENDLESTVDETSDVTHLLEEATTGSTEVRIPEPISAEEGIITDQGLTNLHVAMTSHFQESSPSTAQSESRSGQATQGQTIHVSTLVKDTPVSIENLSSDEFISVTTPIGDAQISATTIAVSPQIIVPATNVASSQTVTPIGGTSSSQTLDVVTLQIVAPADSQEFSQFLAVASTSSNHAGAQIGSTHVYESIIGDRARVIAHLRAQPPPPSLEEVRARRASIKEERRQNINFIRMRTTSRASALALSKASAAPVELSGLPQPSGPLSETTTQGSATTNQSTNPPQLLEGVSELASDGTANDGHASDLHLDTRRLEQLPSPASQENVRPKSGKWIAPLPQDQEWNVPHPPGPSALPASSLAVQKKHKNGRRGAKPVKPSVQSRVSVGTQTGTGLTSCSVGTQTDFGVATSIAEDLSSGAGPVPGRDGELAGLGPQPSVTSRASLQRELELTSIVEDPALEQGCGGEYARGILTMATASTPHSKLVAELREAGVPASALTSLSRSGLEGHEATGCRHQPVGIHLEVETVTIGGVAFEARRRGSRHRIAASMPRLELDW
ncbi:hypothetical protein V496_05330 [Pseudogymnoascus sp. VKM F-4515 (FW-2607)]|nr:hypothetical protein V496_05330 [Pseudogymnoascus sp. VKM F-4515 (FW-2607)]KFY94819.1 hypothetical protein V498_03716 [Pseudogymnoascus sp. VKM F-4517 (FW-2822)]